jgi:Ca-activated chloride channel family protein
MMTTIVLDSPQTLTSNIGFASAVAEFGMLLRKSPYAGGGSYGAAIARAQKFRGVDPEGYRAEFIRLAELAGSIRRDRATDAAP